MTAYVDTLNWFKFNYASSQDLYGEIMELGFCVNEFLLFDHGHINPEYNPGAINQPDSDNNYFEDMSKCSKKELDLIQQFFDRVYQYCKDHGKDY